MASLSGRHKPVRFPFTANTGRTPFSRDSVRTERSFEIRNGTQMTVTYVIIPCKCIHVCMAEFFSLLWIAVPALLWYVIC